MSNPILLVEAQKLLTEWLGECWHTWERKYPYPARTEAELKMRGHVCTKCGEYWPVQPKAEGLITPLNFSDWRVVGRLIEKVRTHRPLGDTITLSERLGYAICSANPQRAICNAIVDYLKETNHE